MTEATRKVILRLKEVRMQKKMSYQDIVDACEAHGEAISMGSVRRIFAKGSEDGSDFRTYTVNAIFNAVIGTEEVELTAAEEASLNDTGKELAAENAALKAVVDLRDATILDLQDQIKIMTENMDELKSLLHDLQIRHDATVDLVRIAMQSFGGAAR